MGQASRPAPLFLLLLLLLILPVAPLLVVLLLSVWPNALADRAAKEQKLSAVQLWVVVMTAVGVLALAIRAWEFTQLNIQWDTNAYGSITWFVLGLHATHLITDLGDTVVLTVLMFTRHGTVGKRLSDVSDNATYWNFVIVSWLPIYVLIYWVPRL